MYDAVQAVDKEDRDAKLEVLQAEIEEYLKEKYGEAYEEIAPKVGKENSKTHDFRRA